MPATTESPDPPAESRILGVVDRVAASVRAVGVQGSVLPLAMGAALASALRTLEIEIAKSPSLARPLAPPSLAPYVGLAAFVALVAGGVAWLRKRGGDARAVTGLYRDTLARGAFLLVLPCVLCIREPIEVPRAWVALALAAFAGGISAYSAYHWASDLTGTERPRLAAAAVLVLSVVYAIVVIRIAFVNHLGFNTGRSDLGYYLSVFRKSSQGVPLGCSLCGQGTHTTGHFDPILVPLSVFFLLHPFAETLLALQAIWLASGAIPVYLLARHQIGHRGAAVAFAFAYLAYPALHGVNFFDFHSIALSIPPFLWFLLFVEQRRSARAYAALAVMLLVREDVSLAAALVGLTCLFSGDRERIRIGWVTIAASVAWFLFAKVAVMGHLDPLNAPASGKGGYGVFYEEMLPPGRSTSGMVGTLIGDPLFSLARILTEAKVEYILLLLVPLLGLPVLARGRLQLAYGAAVTLLATARLYSVHAQYSSTLIPVMFGLALSALGRIRTAPRLPLALSGARLAQALSLGVLVSSFFCSWKFGGIVPNGTFIAGFRPLVRDASPALREDDAWLRRFALSLPRGAGVAANTRLIPHLGPVSNLYMIEQRTLADYVIANVKNPAVARFILADEGKGYLTQIEVRGNYHVYKTKYPKALKGKAAAAGEESEPGGT